MKWSTPDTGFIEFEQVLSRSPNVSPCMRFWQEMERYTSGDGCLDKPCMEVVGLGSSRRRPPTRDVRDRFRDRVADPLRELGVPIVGLQRPAAE